jgi:hypothetical protein
MTPGIDQREVLRKLGGCGYELFLTLSSDFDFVVTSPVISRQDFDHTGAIYGSTRFLEVRYGNGPRHWRINAASSCQSPGTQLGQVRFWIGASGS